MRAAFATIVFAGLAVGPPAGPPTTQPGGPTQSAPGRTPVANPIPQAVTQAIAPSGTPPAGCYPNYQGTFEIGPINVTSGGSGSDKRDLDEASRLLILADESIG